MICYMALAAIINFVLQNMTIMQLYIKLWGSITIYTGPWI